MSDELSVCVRSRIWDLTINGAAATDDNYTMYDEVERYLALLNLQFLKLENVPLVHISPSVCNMYLLLELHLVHVSSVNVPKNCFKQTLWLAHLSAPWNRLKRLDDGTFPGLQWLHTMNIHDKNLHYFGMNFV